MLITFDPAKDSKNIVERGISFSLAHDFDWESAIIREDTRKAYGERRYQGIGYIGKRLYVIVYTIRHTNIRIISLRKANAKERKKYAKEKT